MPNKKWSEYMHNVLKQSTPEQTLAYLNPNLPTTAPKPWP